MKQETSNKRNKEERKRNNKKDDLVSGHNRRSRSITTKKIRRKWEGGGRGSESWISGGGDHMNSVPTAQRVEYRGGEREGCVKGEKKGVRRLIKITRVGILNAKRKKKKKCERARETIKLQV